MCQYLQHSPLQAQIVHDFTVSTLDGAAQEHPELQDKITRCKQIFLQSKMPEHEQIQLLASILKICLLVSFDGGDVVQSFGDESWKPLRLSNCQVVDGAGSAAPHFRMIWISEETSEPKAPVDSLEEAHYHVHSTCLYAFVFTPKHMTWDLSGPAG